MASSTWPAALGTSLGLALTELAYTPPRRPGNRHPGGAASETMPT